MQIRFLTDPHSTSSPSDYKPFSERVYAIFHGLHPFSKGLYTPFTKGIIRRFQRIISPFPKDYTPFSDRDYAFLPKDHELSNGWYTLFLSIKTFSKWSRIFRKGPQLPRIACTRPRWSPLGFAPLTTILQKCIHTRVHLHRNGGRRPRSNRTMEVRWFAFWLHWRRTPAWAQWKSAGPYIISL